LFTLKGKAKLQIKTNSNAAELSSSEQIHFRYFFEMMFALCCEISEKYYKILNAGYLQ